MTIEAQRAHHLLFTGFGKVTRDQIQRYRHAAALIIGINNEDDDAAGLGASDLNDGFAWRHGSSGPDNLALALDEAHKHGLKVIPMIWARPTRRYTEQSAEALEQFLAHPAFGGVCHDLERYWHKLLAPAGLDEAQGAALWLGTWGRDHVKAWITDYAALPHSAGVLLAEALRAGVDAYGIPQAYSRHSWISKDQVWRTPNTQHVARRTWGRCIQEALDPRDSGHPDAKGRLVLGLAAYDLGPTPVAWMRAQLGAAIHREGAYPAQIEGIGGGAPAVAWWSTAAAGPNLNSLLRLVEDTRAPSFPALLHTVQAPATPRAEV
jgi:hypothetical protein